MVLIVKQKISAPDLQLLMQVKKWNQFIIFQNRLLLVNLPNKLLLCHQINFGFGMGYPWKFVFKYFYSETSFETNGNLKVLIVVAFGLVNVDDWRTSWYLYAVAAMQCFQLLRQQIDLQDLNHLHSLDVDDLQPYFLDLIVFVIHLDQDKRLLNLLISLKLNFARNNFQIVFDV